MIQIQESDMLWYFYKRYYKGTQIEEPKNLCNYFWKAVIGASQAFLHDLHAVFTVGCLWLITGLLLMWQYYLGVFTNDFVCIDKISGVFGAIYVVGTTVFFLITIGFFGILSILEPIFRWFAYWSEKDERVATVSCVLLVFSVFTLMFSVTMVGVKDWHWTHLLIAFGIEVGVIIVISLVFAVWYNCFTDNTNLGKNILQYMSAVKNNVCPLVDPPQSFKDAKREAEMNCGDG